MITYPYAKLNLGLFVTGKRPDGYHNIETVFIPLPTLCDILEIVPTPRQSENIRFTHSGLPMECDEGENLCIKAYELMSQRGELPKVVIHLHKQIPIGAGLGGGSADGAFTLSMLNTMASRPLSATDLHSIALNLGSDCPFFLMDIPCFATGRGEMLEPVLVERVLDLQMAIEAIEEEFRRKVCSQIHLRPEVTVNLPSCERL